MTTAARLAALAVVFSCFGAAPLAAGEPLDRPIKAAPLAAGQGVPLAAGQGLPLAAGRGLPLARRLASLEAAGQGVAFRDRRVDPNASLAITARGPLGNVLSDAVAPFDYGVSELGGVIYVGPRDVSRQLRTLAELNRRQVTRLPNKTQQSMRRRDALSWPRLTEPRALVVSLAEGHGLRVANPQRIPHDVWAAGKLPAMPLSDHLTLLLVGFDLTWRPTEEGAIEFVRPSWPVAVRRTHRTQGKIAWDPSEFRALFPAASLRQQGRNWVLEGTVEAHERLRGILRGESPQGGDTQPDEGERRLTLTVRQKPAMAVLQYLGRSLRLKIAGEESFSPAAKTALSRRVDLTLKQATLGETLAAIGRQVELTITLEDDTIVVR